MAETKTIFGSWYPHTLTTREYAALSGDKIYTHLGLIDSPKNDQNQPDGPLFIDITAVGGFRIAGKGANSYITWERTSDGEWHRHPDACGNYSVMWDLEGNLHISDCSIGTQGWRGIWPDGSLATGDHTILFDGINEFTFLGDDIYIGQGNATGGVVVQIDGIKRQLADGACYDIKARRVGNDVAISFYLVARDGLSSHFWWGTVDELRQLKELVIPPPPPPPTPEPPDPTMDTPVITVASFDQELVSGKNWQTTFSTNGITFQVIKDAKDQLVITAVNAAGSTATGAVRQLKLTPVLPSEPVPTPDPVPVPDPPKPDPDPNPIPVPVRDSRFWITPSPAAADLKAIFDDPQRLNNVGGFQFYTQQIMDDEPLPNWGPNGYNYLKETFAKLRALGIATGVEMGSVKVEDPEATSNTNTLEPLFNRFSDVGGKLSFIAMDEPRTSGIKLGQSPEQTAAYMSKFIAKAKELHPDVKVVWIEAWPFVPFGDFSTIRNLLTIQPDLIRLDVNWHDAEKEGKDPVQFLHSMDAVAPVSILVNSTEDPIATDEAHDTNLVALATKLKGILPNAPQVMVQSWASRAEGAPQDVPNNLGEHGLLATFEKVRAIFTGTEPTPVPDPVPTPVPQESKVLKSTVSEQPIVVKTVKPVTGTKLSTLILPDDTVYSCQPGGADDVRPAGTEGDFEKCRVSGNLATFRPDKKTNDFFTKPFVETEEL